jgi:CHAT domain-containing protein
VLAAGQHDRVSLIDLGAAAPIEEALEHVLAWMCDPAASIATKGVKLLAHLPSPAPALAIPAEAHALRRLVFDPLLPALEGRTRLFLCPDGTLWRLPFEALPADDGNFLLDRFQISYLTTGRDLLRFREPPVRKPGRAVVAADPDYDLAGIPSPSDSSPVAVSRDLTRDGTTVFGQLSGAREEGRRIAGLLGVEPWLGRTPSEPLKSRFLPTAAGGQPSPAILHVSTHGFCLPDLPRELLAPTAPLDRMSRLEQVESPLLRSGLALSGANTWLRGQDLPAEAGNGLLTAHDVMGMDLLDTRLVVLSACVTGLGDVHASEGVQGLRRAFVEAGARALLMSLWEVSDDSTLLLMEGFYRRLLAGADCAAALREAQLELKRSRPHPSHWAPFVCQGDPGPVDLSH